MGKRRRAKKVDKFEKKAEKFKDKAAARAQELSGQASVKAQELGEKAAVMAGKKEPEKRSKKGLLALVTAALAGVGLFLKRKREQELDEALWEEPRAL